MCVQQDKLGNFQRGLTAFRFVQSFLSRATREFRRSITMEGDAATSSNSSLERHVPRATFITDVNDFLKGGQAVLSP
jgi:hypothetical protein